MPKNRRFINKNHEERLYPDSPNGLLVAAWKNKDFPVGEYQQACCSIVK
ncbi:hypothetical protein [Arsenophonus sp. ENCA]|nr:hypothetical protein [Arsenophonus sp. ENCA]